MAVTQYIGARYVPLFAEPIEWSSEYSYEPLTIVLYQGSSYTSRQAVPTGIDISNEQYWALTGNYNAQVEQYRSEITDAMDNVADNATKAETAATTAQSAATMATEQASAAATSAANAKTSEGNALVSANASQQAAQNSAAAEIKSETAAATATEQASAAATSAANAKTSETNAAASATAAAASAESVGTIVKYSALVTGNLIYNNVTQTSAFDLASGDYAGCIILIPNVEGYVPIAINGSPSISAGSPITDIYKAAVQYQNSVGKTDVPGINVHVSNPTNAAINIGSTVTCTVLYIAEDYIASA